MNFKPSDYIKTNFSIHRIIEHIPDIKISLTINCFFNRREYCASVSELEINDEMYMNQYNVCSGYFNINNDTFTMDFEIQTKPQQYGIGTLLLDAMFEIASRYQNKYNTHLSYVTGWLSNADYNYGNWNTSISFYSNYIKYMSNENPFYGKLKKEFVFNDVIYQELNIEKCHNLSPDNNGTKNAHIHYLVTM